MSTTKRFACSLTAIVGSVIVASGALFAVGHPVTSFPWAGAPRTSEIEPLIETAWMKHPPPDEAWYRSRYHTGFEGGVGSPPTDEGGGPAVSTDVRDQKVGQARWGRDQSGRAFTYWTVIVSMRTKHHWIESKPRRIESKLPWPEPSPPAFSLVPKNAVTIRDCTSKCYAIRIEGAWTITFAEPIDETLFFKFW